MAEIRKAKLKIARASCAINSYRGGVAAVQALSFCPVSDTHSWFDGLLPRDYRYCTLQKKKNLIKNKYIVKSDTFIW